ncbi:ParB N-terminal domain-containing protein [Streptomyces sp. 184]|uniref:ParB N-terminal domain-containing protein n=1 Tax=Streptomyces sp. 184 TaxID=1827526 RepID=UPI003891544A
MSAEKRNAVLSLLPSSSAIGTTKAEGAERAEGVGEERGGTGPDRVPVDRLLRADSPRLDGVDHDHVRVLAEVETELPPILVHRATMRVIDGMHRLHAARLTGQPTVRVRYFDGTEGEAFVAAVEANISHGRPLTLADRRVSARRIVDLYPRWSDRAIAAKAGLSGKTVAAIRREHGGPDRQSSARLGQDGRVRPLDAAAGRMRAGDVIAENPGATLREIAEAAGISVTTARDVRLRLRRGDSPLPGGRRAGEEPARDLPPRPRATDCAPALDSLRRDPALRYTVDGRALLRWLETHVVSDEDVARLTGVPPHRMATLALVARCCSAVWEQVANELEGRGAGRGPCP